MRIYLYFVYMSLWQVFCTLGVNFGSYFQQLLSTHKDQFYWSQPPVATIPTDQNTRKYKAKLVCLV